MLPRHRNNKAMLKLEVKLPNGWVFYVKHKRTMKTALPNNVIIKRRYKKRGRRKQGKEIGKVFNFIEKVAKSPIVKDIWRLVVKTLPKVYHKGINKIRTKVLNKLFNLTLPILFWTWELRAHIINYSNF